MLAPFCYFEAAIRRFCSYAPGRWCEMRVGVVDNGIRNRAWNRAGASRARMVALLAALMLTACQNDKPVAGGQVIAHIGDQVITAPELDAELRLANVSPEKAKDPAVLRQVLSEMVTRKYLEQQALNAKLDREPGILLELLRARSQVLASAYANRIAAAKPITQSEVDKFITNNPLKFEQRQMLTTDQITLPVAAQTPSVADANKNATTLEEIDKNLTAAGISHGRASGAISTADIPQEFYNLIQEKKDSSVFFVRSGNNGVYFKVKAIEPAPLKGDAAQLAARQYLRADRLNAEMGLASVSAKMEAKFTGDYAQIMKDGSTAQGKD